MEGISLWSGTGAALGAAAGAALGSIAGPLCGAIAAALGAVSWGFAGRELALVMADAPETEKPHLFTGLDDLETQEFGDESLEVYLHSKAKPLGRLHPGRAR